MLETLDVADTREWRAWLEKNHLSKDRVWLVFHKKASRVLSISYDEALDEALAYGWIDSVIRKIDEEKYARKFTPRRPGSIWSKINIDRVDRLTKEGRMTEYGLAAFRIRTGEISQAEKFKTAKVRVPRDLEDALKGNRTAWENFQRFTQSYRKRYLMWIAAAKKPETRRRRIGEAVVLISKNVKNLLK